MSEDPVTPSEETHPPEEPGNGGALPESKAAPADGKETPKKDATPKRGLLRRIGSFSYKAAKKIALVTALTSPIRGTPGNMILRGLQTTGIIPILSNVESREVPYKHVADKEFAEGIAAAKLPAIPLQEAHIKNYVMEPNGVDIPVFLLHGEHIGFIEAARRLNTNLYHGQDVATSYHDTLEKVLGREPDVKYIDGLVSQGIIFSGPQIELLGHSKTIVNNSVCMSSLDHTRDSSKYKAWIFHAAGNIGDEVAKNQLQPQPGGQTYHGPRSVLVGSPYYYSSHCGPAFYCDTSHKGSIKGEAARIDFLPSAAEKSSLDENGRKKIYPGWGGTSNSSPSAAAKFSALMERYSNYLSEEQIFNALCYSVAQTTKTALPATLATATATGNKYAVEDVTNQLNNYYSTNLPGRKDRHFYDPLTHGFGDITQAALEQADSICQDMVIYSMHRPHSVCKPTTYEAGLNLSEHARADADGMYHYRLQLPAEVNLNNVVVKGSTAVEKLDNEQLFLIANEIKIRIPIATTSPWQEFLGISREKTSFVGSTRGFTTSGPLKDIEVVSSMPLGNDFHLTCYNTLGSDDVVSHLADLHAQVDILQSGKNPASLQKAKMIDPDSVDPKPEHVPARLYPGNLTHEEILQAIQQQMSRNEHIPTPDPDEGNPNKHQQAYWRRRENDPPPQEAYTGKMV